MAALGATDRARATTGLKAEIRDVSRRARAGPSAVGQIYPACRLARLRTHAAQPARDVSSPHPGFTGTVPNYSVDPSKAVYTRAQDERAEMAQNGKISQSPDWRTDAPRHSRGPARHPPPDTNPTSPILSIPV